MLYFFGSWFFYNNDDLAVVGLENLFSFFLFLKKSQFRFYTDLATEIVYGDMDKELSNSKM